MFKIKLSYLILLLLCMGCQRSADYPGTEIEIETDQVQLFLNTHNYRYSSSKSDVPESVIDSLGKINGKSFKLGDSTDADKISFSDAKIEGMYEYDTRLNFMLFNDTTCLLVYTEGGIGTHDVVDYFRYRGKYVHIRYTTADILSDTIQLRQYLELSPDPADE